MRKSPIQDLIDYLGFGYEEFIFAQLTPKQIQSYMLSYVKSLREEERNMVKEAFLYGYECSGKCDNPEALADLYYAIKYQRRKYE